MIYSCVNQPFQGIFRDVAGGFSHSSRSVPAPPGPPKAPRDRANRCSGGAQARRDRPVALGLGCGRSPTQCLIALAPGRFQDSFLRMNVWNNVIALDRPTFGSSWGLNGSSALIGPRSGIPETVQDAKQLNAFWLWRWPSWPCDGSGVSLWQSESRSPW